jgi:hypothetical protein
LPIIAGMSPDTIRISLAGGDAAELDARIASLTAAMPLGTQVTVSRGVVFNRHGMPPTPAALLSAVRPT